MEDSWVSKKAEEIQSFADKKNMKSTGATPLFTTDGSTLLTDKGANLERWKEHLNNMLNLPLTIYDNAINRLLQIESVVLLDEIPTVTE